MQVAAATPEEAARLSAHLFNATATAWTIRDFAAPGVIALTDAPHRQGLIAVRVAADEAEILDFGVAPDARRRGTGAALLAAAEQAAAAKGAGHIFLEVAESNTPARALYAKRGYREAGRRPRYYIRPDGSREDALILRRDLAERGTSR